MQALRGCPYIVQLHEAAFNGPPPNPVSAVLLMDYCPDTLVGFLQQRSYQLDERAILAVFVPVCRAVQAMHSMQPPLAHRWGRGGQAGEGGHHQRMLNAFLLEMAVRLVLQRYRSSIHLHGNADKCLPQVLGLLPPALRPRPRPKAWL